MMMICLKDLSANLFHGFYLVIAQAPAPVFGRMLLEGHVLCGHSQLVQWYRPISLADGSKSCNGRSTTCVEEGSSRGLGMPLLGLDTADRISFN